MQNFLVLIILCNMINLNVLTQDVLTQNRGLHLPGKSLFRPSFTPIDLNTPSAKILAIRAKLSQATLNHVQLCAYVIVLQQLVRSVQCDTSVCLDSVTIPSVSSGSHAASSDTSSTDSGSSGSGGSVSTISSGNSGLLSPSSDSDYR